MSKGETCVKMEIIEPKYFMLKCKYIIPELSYETYLFDIINFSPFFRSKCSFMEQYIPVEKQSNGEDDAYTSSYQMDFKLLVDEDVMRERNRNKPEVDYSQMSKGFIFTKTKENVEKIPQKNILEDIMRCDYDDLISGKYPSKTIKNLTNNLHKKKNLFLYYPYEFVSDRRLPVEVFENMLTQIFKVILRYRDHMNTEKDTFICMKVNQLFLIFEWADGTIQYRDSVNEILCSNYRDMKLYSVY